MQSCCFGFEQHRGHWAVFSAAFHHAERAPRVISSLTAESPTIRSFKTSFGPDIGVSPPVSCAQGRLVNERFYETERVRPPSHIRSDHRRTSVQTHVAHPFRPPS